MQEQKDIWASRNQLHFDSSIQQLHTWLDGESSKKGLSATRKNSIEKLPELVDSNLFVADINVPMSEQFKLERLLHIKTKLENQTDMISMIL